MTFAVVDVDYHGSGATAAGVVAFDWSDAVPCETCVVEIAEVAPYVPGHFYVRELPCVLAVVERIHEAIDTIVVDGYVYLDDHKTPGLGARLYEHYSGRYGIIGVAKTPYKGAEFAAPVVRGGSRRPLYVTAAGIDQDHAAQLVADMHGSHRIPTLLGWVDRLAAGDPPAWPRG